MFPYFSYRDARAAISWLETAFGFETVGAYPGEDGSIVHAEMRFGGGVLMLGTAEPPPVTSPGGVSPNAHGVYVQVDDVDAHFERARQAGARVVYPPEDTGFGTRRYRVLDPGGYEWSFGSYAPGQAWDEA